MKSPTTFTLVSILVSRYPTDSGTNMDMSLNTVDWCRMYTVRVPLVLWTVCAARSKC
jgi:hypothetical protein